MLELVALIGLSGLQGYNVRIDALIENLGSNTWEVRESAERDLDKIGLHALPKLLRERKSVDLERRKRCIRLASRIQRRELYNPNILTYACNKRKVSDVLKDFAAHTGTAVETKPDFRDVEVSLDFKAKTFWEAIEILAKASGNHIVANNGFKKCEVALSATPGRGVAKSGIALGNFDRILKWNADSTTPESVLRLHFDVVCERKIKLYGYYEDVQLIEAETDQGEKLWMSSIPRRPRLAPTNNDKNCKNLSVVVRHPTQACSRLKTLKVAVRLSAFPDSRPTECKDWDNHSLSEEVVILEFSDIKLRFE